MHLRMHAWRGRWAVLVAAAGLLVGLWNVGRVLAHRGLSLRRQEGVSARVGQNEPGREAFDASCSACHSEKDVRTLLLMATRATMPQYSPGSLRDREYADILDYVFNAARGNEYDIESASLEGAGGEKKR